MTGVPYFSVSHLWPANALLHVKNFLTQNICGARARSSDAFLVPTNPPFCVKTFFTGTPLFLQRFLAILSWGRVLMRMAAIKVAQPFQPLCVARLGCNKGLARGFSEKPHFFFKEVDSRQPPCLRQALDYRRPPCLRQSPGLQKATLAEVAPGLQKATSLTGKKVLRKPHFFFSRKL